MDPTAVAAPFLAQGVLGAAVVVLGFVIWRLWTHNNKCTADALALAEKNHELQRQMLERVLASMNTMGGIVSDNTKAMELVLKRRESKP